MFDSSVDRDPVERLAEEFLERHRRGEHPPLTEYTNRHPEWAERIRELFPALVMMERLKPATGDVTGSYLGSRTSQARGVPERLGDFRILREIGRGGMGIVYEAEQESLGRHVALKVLPSCALLNPRHLQRFLREARAAARLHHTNIVPVFGVGEENGLHYYVMQFIAGSGLHEVIDELRRMRSADRPTAEAESGQGSPPIRGLHQIARGFMTGRFAEADAEATTKGDTDDGDSDDGPSPPGATAPLTGVSLLSGSGRCFAKEVARVGHQVAEALAYAHGQGVLHRDIKPSNLLVDVRGTVWVTDLGLAKAVADGDDLTNEGDVLGTLRYMAPERFRGRADARSDLYALGLTLYELLTFRPAFDQEDRDQLILQVTTEVPPRPRAINREIPRDLETIVLKAIDHDPAGRYQDAEELADDLGRFLADRPIGARPVGALERAAKWARRTPMVAGLVAALALAVVLGFVGVTWQWRVAVAASRASDRHADEAQRNFDHAMRTVDTFYTQVSQEQLLDQPGMLELRRRLLDLALQHYLEFQGQQDLSSRERRDDNVVLTRALALSFMHSGMIKNEFGEASQATAALLRAKDLLLELSGSYPQDLALREQLTRCCLEIEDVERLNDFEFRHMKGIAVNPSVLLAEGLVAADPDNHGYRILLARGYDLDGLRWLRWRPDSYAEAESNFRKAMALLERVHHAIPVDFEGARYLALAHAHIALAHQQAGRHADRVAALARALAILRTRDDRHQKGRQFALDYAECLIELGYARMDLGCYPEAEARLTEAVRSLVPLNLDGQRTADVRYRLALAKQGLGRVALARGRNAKAAVELRESIGFFDGASQSPRAGRELLLLGWSQLWLGRLELQAGRPDAVPEQRAKLDEVVNILENGILAGFTVPQQTVALARLKEDAGNLTRFARAASAAEWIACQQRELQTWRERSAKNRANPDARFEMASALVRLAELQLQVSQAVEAQSSLDEAIPILEALVREEPGSLRWRQGLARGREAVGRMRAASGHRASARVAVEAAVTIAQELARADPAYSYDLACMLNLRGQLESCAVDAMAAVVALRRAIDAGFDNGHLLRTDHRLDGIRSRHDFPAKSASARRPARIRPESAIGGAVPLGPAS